MRLFELLDRAAEEWPRKEALVWKDQRVSFSEWERLSHHAARMLRKLGLEFGDRVALLMENSLPFAVAYMAALRLGAVVVPLDYTARPDNLVAVMNDCTVKGLITQGNLFHLVSAMLAQVPSLSLVGFYASTDRFELSKAIRVFDLEAVWKTLSVDRVSEEFGDQETALILYTSGTTGYPKGVMLSHSNLDWGSKNIVQFLEISSADREVNALPLSHLFGLAHIHCYCRAGGTMILEKNLRFPDRVLERIWKEKATSFPGVPASYAILLDRYEPLLRKYAQGLRYIILNSAAMPPERTKHLQSILPKTRIFMYYGLTEASRSTYIEYNVRDEKQLRSVGKASPNVEVYVLDEAGRPVRPGEMGEVVVKGPTVMKGYWNRPEETAAVLQPEGLHTGDSAITDEEGFIYLLGRLDDVINVGGLKVTPLEIENVIAQFPGVREVAVVGVPDPQQILGEVIKAYIVVEHGKTIDSERLRFYCSRWLELYKVPQFIEFVGDLPKTDSGKLRRTTLRSMHPSRQDALQAGQGS